MAVLFSVVVCTYNRSALMADAVRSICEQEFDRSLFEVLIVDNNSTDDTRAVSEALAGEFPNVRYVVEVKQGLSHARNCGYLAARGKYVGYLDDDAVANPHWLTAARRIFEEEGAVICGGPFTALYRSPKPKWFKDEYGSRYMDQPEREIGEKECLPGGNSFYTRELLEAIGGYDPELGMTGKTVAYGEDTDLQWRAREQYPDAKFILSPDLYMSHLVRPEKMTLWWRMSFFYGKGRTAWRMGTSNHTYAASVPDICREACRIILHFSLNFSIRMLSRDRKKFPNLQNYLYEIGFAPFRRLGILHEQFLEWRRK